MIAAFNHFHAVGKTVLGHLRLDALHFRLADRHIYGSDARGGGEGTQRMDQDGNATQGEKLLGLGSRHPRAQARCGKNRKDLHRVEYSTGPTIRWADRGPRYDPGVSSSKLSLRLETARLRPGLRVAVGLSGGADSVALLRALHERRNELGLVLHAAHLHHGLRGAEADEDLAFCRDLAASLGVQFHEERVDTAASARKDLEGGKAGESIEEAARRLRYGWFRDLMRTGAVEAVATAHTRDDQAETVLARLLRGAWTEGIAGIHPVIQFAEGMVVRPLLTATRKEVEEFLRQTGQTWREDSSNRHLTFTRNRIRHELLPELESWNPRLREHLAHMAELARDEEAWWGAEVVRLAPQYLLPGRPVRGGGRAAAGGSAIDLIRLAELPLAVQRRLLRHAAGQLGADIDFTATEALRKFAAGGRAGQKLELPNGLRVERTYRELQLASVSAAPAGPGSAGEVIRVAIPGEIEVPRLGLRLKLSGAAGSSNGQAQRAVLRPWKSGDRVRLRYSSGVRKVKEVLERLHVSGSDRAGWLVLEWEKRILWMQGVEVEPEAGIRVEALPLEGVEPDRAC